MRTTFVHLSAAAIAIVALAACGGDATSPPGPPAAIKLVTSADLTVPAGDTFHVGVRVVDASGRGIPGALVRASAGGTVVLDDAIRTDGHGSATLRVVAPTRAGLGGVDIGIDPSAYPGGVIPSGGGSSSYVEMTFHSVAGPFAQFVPHARTQLAGTTFAIDSLFTPADKYGNATSWPAVQVSATNGWQMTTTTLTPPSATYTGTALVSVTSGSVTATDTASVVEDLRRYHWNIQWKCDYTHSGMAGLPDSTSASGTSGFATYQGDPGFARIMGKVPVLPPFVELWFTGTEIEYRNGLGLPQNIMTSEPYGFDVFAQRPDTLIFGLGAPARFAVREPGTIPRYVAADWCGDGPMVLQAY